MTAPTKADAAAADRLLKAAVRRAVSLIRAGEPYARDNATVMLTAAGESADLLLGTTS